MLTALKWNLLCARGFVCSLPPELNHTVIVGFLECRVLEQDPPGELVVDAYAAADAVQGEDQLAKAPQGLVDQFWMFRLPRTLLETIPDSVGKIAVV